MNLLRLGIAAVERGLLPDWLTRRAIRRLCRQRLLESDVTSPQRATDRANFLASLHRGPIAPVPEKANQQHYELPGQFFALMLGPRLKYSSCYWPDGVTSLADAEHAALDLTCQRADLQDDQDILELGCGWGSLSLWMAEKYPASHITAVSNSVPQRHFIESAAARRRLTNLRVVTADMNQFTPSASVDDGKFDRIVSVEMLEHMRNIDLLLFRIATWLRPEGKLFFHHFCHRHWSYPFETNGPSDWMGRYFFTGGMMPNGDMLRGFNCHLRVTEAWNWSGLHYQRTAQAWLQNLDARRGEALKILKSVYGNKDAGRWLARWRIFLLAVAELFGYGGGQEWFVAHRLMQPSSIHVPEIWPCLSSS
jgi:cyclopropane-fatty-acyl-phospholipid synthase